MTVTVREAGPQDAPALNDALAALSEFMGDAHAASAEDLRAAGWGDEPAFRAWIAERDGAIVGAVMFSPVYSTIRGAAGVFVSDLWVAEALRGSGLGRRLLATARAEGLRLWGARFLKLSVYDNNPGARAAYERMGFEAETGARTMMLEGRPWTALGEDA
ncbi:MAG: N-acetyltransferase family protein [Pseudomonadota bacterium]